MADAEATTGGSDRATERMPRLSFRARLTLTLLFASILPLLAFATIVLAFQTIFGRGLETTLIQLILFALAVLLAFAILASFALATELTAPLRAMVAAVDRVSRGDRSSRMKVVGDDELAR
ncbi:MAG: HAMP domain-containing protein, partial [Candidatus Limnocylindrales bacterium]